MEIKERWEWREGERERERGREGGREGEREREIERQTDRQTDRERFRHCQFSLPASPYLPFMQSGREMIYIKWTACEVPL